LTMAPGRFMFLRSPITAVLTTSAAVLHNQASQRSAPATSRRVGLCRH
jgi:hypothetical protein